MQQGTAVAEALTVMNAGGSGTSISGPRRDAQPRAWRRNPDRDGVTLAGPAPLRRATYLTRLPGLSLGLRSAGAWFLNR